MPENLLEQLGKKDVPRPPLRLRREVDQRVNNGLLALQFVDLALRGLPYAMLHFAKAVGGMILFTLTGSYEPRYQDDARRDDR